MSNAQRDADRRESGSTFDAIKLATEAVAAAVAKAFEDGERSALRAQMALEKAAEVAALESILDHPRPFVGVNRVSEPASTESSKDSVRLERKFHCICEKVDRCERDGCFVCCFCGQAAEIRRIPGPVEEHEKRLVCRLCRVLVTGAGAIDHGDICRECSVVVHRDVKPENVSLPDGCEESASEARMRVALETILWHASGDCPHTADEHIACFAVIEEVAKIGRGDRLAKASRK